MCRNILKISFFLVIAGFNLFLSYSSAYSAISVDIVRPSSISNVLANSRHTFLVYLSNNGSSLSSPDTTLEISVTNGTFYSSTGTSSNHFSILPASGANPAIFQSDNDFTEKSIKTAVVTLVTGSSGTLSISVQGQVSGMSDSTSLNLPITGDHGFTELHNAYAQLALARYDITNKFILMYKNYIATGNIYAADVDQNKLGADLVDLCRISGNIITVTGLLADFIQNPGVAIYGSFLEIVGAATGQPNLMDVYEIIDYAGKWSFKHLYHDLFGGGKILVQLSDDNYPGLLDEYLTILGNESAAWNNNDITPGTGTHTVLETLDQEKEKLEKAITTAKEIADSVDPDHKGAEAFFNMIMDFSAGELEVIQFLRASAKLMVNNPPVFSQDPVSPLHNATGVNIDDSYLSWSCSDPDGNSIIYSIYLKKQSDSSYELLNVNPITNTTGLTVERLEPSTTYQWYVKAVDTNIDAYMEKGESVISPIWSFSTESVSIAEIDLFYVPNTATVNKPVEADAIVNVTGMTAQLRFESWLNGVPTNLGTYDVYSNPDPQHFSVKFSLPSAEYHIIKAVLSSGGDDLVTKSAGINVDSQANPGPSLVEILVEGTVQEGMNHLYDSGSITVNFMVWDDGDLADIQSWMKYLFAENEPVNWDGISEVELIYQSSESITINESGSAPYSLTVARLAYTIPAAEFGPLANGQKTLWLQPKKFTDGLSTISGLDRVVKIPGYTIRDDDTISPVIKFEGQDSQGGPLSMILAPRRLDADIYVGDTTVLREDGTIEDYSSGIAQALFGYAFTENQPESLDDTDFTFYDTVTDFQGYHHSKTMILSPGAETMWITIRVNVTEADSDWIGDGFVVSRDWSGQIPDDDASGPAISDVTFPSARSYDQIISLTCTITDPSGLTINQSNGKNQAVVYLSFDKNTWSGPLFYTSYDETGLYRFDFPPVGADHIGEKLYLYIEAVDGDNDRVNDTMTTVANNGGQYYSVDILDGYSPVIADVNIVDGAVLSGNATLSANVTDEDVTTLTVKINGDIVSRSLPFVWNTDLPSWSEPATIVNSVSGGGHCISAGDNSELWIGYISEGNLYVTHSSDGSNWDTPVLAAVPQDTIMRPCMLRDSSGTLWLAFQDYKDFYMTLYIVYSSDNGQTWSEPVQATANIDVVGMSLFQDSHGRYWYVFYSYDHVEWNNIICVMGSDNGLQWDTPVTVDPNPDGDLDYLMPLITESPDGILNVFYQYMDSVNSESHLTRVTSSDGVQWSDRSSVSITPENSNLESCGILKDLSGTYWIAFIKNSFTYLAPSTDLVSWGNPVVVADHGMSFDMAQSGDNTVWFTTYEDNTIRGFHSTIEDEYTITIEATDGSGNSTIHTISHITVFNQPGSYTLSVNSPHGSPQGAGVYDADMEVSASVTSPVVTGTGIRYVCTGYTGTGSAPSTGNTSSVTFTLDSNSAVTFDWRTDIYLTINNDPSELSVPEESGWYEQGSQASISAEPDVASFDGNLYRFTGWSLNGVPVQGNPPSVTIDSPATITAHYFLLGDANGDSHLSLEDAVIILKFLTSMDENSIELYSDVNNDNVLGIPELIYVLQKLAHLR